MVKLVVSVVFVLGFLKAGMVVLRALARPRPEPPPPGEMRRVSLRYRCSTCGTELRMTSAPDEDPPPPRHCMEEMDPVRQKE
ncbi:MAG: hypothetical protein ACRDZW_09910 [Acidimicrobiales bacterium]